MPPKHTTISTPSVIKHFSQLDLSRRWAISPRTLERWRWTGEGPRYLKLNGRIVYREADVEAFEQSRLHENTRALVRQSPVPSFGEAPGITSTMSGKANR